MNQDMSIASLVLNASWVVQIVMLLLLGVSVASWAAIFRKVFALKRVKALNEEFERDFCPATASMTSTPAPRRTPRAPARWNASSPAACASIKNCVSAASAIPAP